MKNHNLIFLLVLAGGLLFFFLGCQLTFFDKNEFEETTATIQQIDREYTGTDADGHAEYITRVYVTYTTPDGITYDNQELGYYQTGYTVGGRIKIYYKKSAPSVIRADSSFMGIIMLIVGLVLAAASFFIRKAVKKNSEEAQKKNEEKIQEIKQRIQDDPYYYPPR